VDQGDLEWLIPHLLLLMMMMVMLLLMMIIVADCFLRS
jgi:hypothetical protein